MEKFGGIHRARGGNKLKVLGGSKEGLEANLKILQKYDKFYKLITSEIGQELLQNAMSRMNLLLEKIVAIDASEEEKMEYNVYFRIFNEWADKISAYLTALDKMKGVVK